MGTSSDSAQPGMFSDVQDAVAAAEMASGVTFAESTALADLPQRRAKESA